MTSLEEYAHKSTPDRALLWLYEHPTGGTTGQIARLLQVNINAAGMALVRLKSEGWVDFESVRETQDPRGRRWLTRHWKVKG
mgnify:FL=1